MKQKTTRFALTLLLSVLTTIGAWAQSPIGSIQYNRTGGYYEIGSTDNLNDLAVYVNGSGSYTTGGDTETTAHDCTGLTFKQTTNITYSHGDDANEDVYASNYTAIGFWGEDTDYHPFKGTFDGQGHTISGIRIYKGGNGYNDIYQGLFGIIEGATIRGITLTDTRITGNSGTGGIVGSNAGTVTDCHVTATVAIHAVLSNVINHGGIVGFNAGTVSYCTSAATLTITSSNVVYYFGGIAGLNTSNGNLSNNLAIGAVVPAVDDKIYGAICGYNEDATLSHNYYYGCTVAGVANATDVGCALYDGISSYTPADVTVNDGAMHLDQAPIPYVNANGNTAYCTTYTTVESSSTSWNSGWFVVNSNTTISDRITVSGTVNLILTNNATLTASKGITVGSDATLNIYAQTDDEATMGALVASGANDNQQYNAGIGGVDNTAAGTITINGGKINATGKMGAGIGSGGQSGATVGTITINGGIVTAQDGDGYGAGIGGGGILGKASTINLNGGVIHAAGIGSGMMGGDCSITVNISDGVKKIVATPVQGGACIGKGMSASGSVTVNFISGGNIVTGDDKDAVFYDTDEGSERQIRAKALNHTVTMSDDLKANITVNTEYALEGETITLTLGTAVDASTLKVNDGTSDLTLTDAGNRNYTFTMPAGNVTVTATLLQTYAVSLPANMEVVSATNAADADGKYITGTTVTFMASFPYAASNVSDGTSTLEPDANGIYTVTVADADITVTATVERSATIDLSDANGDFNAIEGDVLTGTTSHTVTIADGAGITLSGATISGGIVCEGTATITLVGTNSVSGATNTAGIQIGGSGTTLTINGDGTLTANGGDDSAGIGLNRAWNVTEDVVGGNIVINGGNITANGGGGGAGIGAGVTKYENNAARTATVGNITIAGGSVTAVGGSNADGIGAGQNNYNATIQIGTIKIYDGIEKVDASAITESVTYMHVDGNTETDVTASASTYFTITEDGDRRVIVPKDNTDYNITIADGIEHGTLTGAATAKYMEKVTITATPALGYRFSRLVVKDAQNNSVESTGNSFFMPKSNVTVSAVFEQGTHGTTEFEWFYQTGPNPEDIVLETIYDGVTTVNIQNREMSYKIRKYEGKTYYKFLLDNNTYDADIPYAGGTGEFYKLGNPTNFKVPYDGETGYYDITMTDTGNGKWSVSILKTVAVMDAVPDQTYSGSAITPEPTVIAGSLSLTKGTDYVYSYTNNTNVGTAKVRATFQGTYAWLGYVEKEFAILPSTVMVSVTGSGTVTCGDRSATDGTSFGVMSEKGASVTLTLAPENGYAVRSVAYGYTNNSGTTASGIKLPISGTTATLTVPDDLKDGTGVTVTVTFAPALNGGADETSAVALTDATVTDLGGGWYKVDSNITFDHTLNLLGDTHLIIADGKTMTVNTASNRGIYSDYTLFVSGAGALNVTTTSSGIAVCVGNYVQTGATVTASGYIGIRCKDDFLGFDFDNDFTFSGGQLTATGSGGGGIDADNDITLSCTNATDFIQASSYSSGYGAVKIADGKALTDGTEASNGMNGYSGTLTNEQRIAIGSKTLHRAVTTSYVDASGTLHENVIAIPLDNTMTTLAAGWYVVNENVDYTGKITLSGNVKLILGDGCTMSVTNTGTGNEDFAIYGDSGSLHIYGQSQGTGALTATANSSVAIKVDDYITINGGTVNAKGIYSDGNVTINGGKVTSTSDPGICSNSGTIILGLSNATDYITAESYNGAVKVADGQTLVDDGGNIYTGTLTSEQITAIAGKTLRPVMGVVLTKDGSGNISAEFDGTSLETVSIPVNITVNSVTLNRTFTYDRCATLMLPFSLGDGQSLNGGILYKFDGVNNGEGDWVATLSEFTSPLKANTPYLIKPNGHMTDDKITFDLNGGTVTLNTTTAGEDSNEKDDLWDFIGTYSYIKWTTVTGDQDYSAEREAEIGKVYGFAAVEKTGIHVGDFVRVASGAKIRPMCAYLKWKGSIPNNARALTRAATNDDTELPQRITVKLVSANGETTAIGTLDTTTGEVSFDSEAWYTLDGVRLSGKPTKKGLYINNGKKIVIK